MPTQLEFSWLAPIRFFRGRGFVSVKTPFWSVLHMEEDESRCLDFELAIFEDGCGTETLATDQHSRDPRIDLANEALIFS